jgi:hypothetical protein
MLNHHHADLRVASVLQAVSSARAVDHDVPRPNRKLRPVEGHVSTTGDDHIDFLVIDRMSVDPDFRINRHHSEIDEIHPQIGGVTAEVEVISVLLPPGVASKGRQGSRQNRDSTSFRSSLCSSRFGATAEDLNNEAHLVPAACAGDMWARELILGCAKPLGQMLRALAVGIGLDRTAVMGGFAQSLGPLYLQFLQQAMDEEHAFPGFPAVDSRLLELCDAEDDLGLLGAAIYAHQLHELPSTHAV